MKQSEIEIGKIYAAKISGHIVPVKIKGEHSSLRGWIGVNQRTQREVRIRSAGRLRYRLDPLAPAGTMDSKTLASGEREE